MDSSQENVKQNMKVAGVVSFYMSAALVMVFVNKAVLNSTPELPLLFLLIQLILAVILLHAAAFLTPKVEIPQLNFQTAKKLTPVTLVNVIGLVFNILCLRGVEASFFQIARGMVLPLTIAVSCIHTRSIPSLRVIFAAVIVTTGFLLGVAPRSAESLHWRSSPSALSILYGVLSSLFIAVHAVLIKSSLPHAQNSTIQLAYWQNLGSAIFLAPFILLQGEYGKLQELISTPSWNGTVFAWGSLVTGVFGFLLCVAGLLSIKVTSPITHMFSSRAYHFPVASRSVPVPIQPSFTMLLQSFADASPCLLFIRNRALSILVIALGTMYYTWVKSVENASAPRMPAPRPTVSDIESGSLRKLNQENVVVWEADEKRIKEED
ncbi:hypothetical protein NLI96_g6981 [Meripilus lineatus]|uniref:Sugar phosphate transporter domain-containing protein n=1 Tax=Meripilus lineatus TaxID=2056292 RepID=A0AAD5V016_9APHY|nr:hypothetical protein NLI96_g6981 [Physisporinus lineatus]